MDPSTSSGHDLAPMIDDLCARWALTRTPEPTRRGYGGVAIFVTRVDGSPTVLKLTTATGPDDFENVVLAAWNGRHAVRLLERDDDRRARLLERLGPESLAQRPDPLEAMAVGGDLAAKLAISPPPGLPRLADMAPEIADSLERAVPVGLDERDVRRAVDTYRTLGADQPETLIHADLQGSNVLRSGGDRWAAIDPLGLVGEVALEALTLVRDRWASLPDTTSPGNELRRWLSAFAEAAGAPVERVVDWTHARCVRAVCAAVTDDEGRHAFLAGLLGSRER